MTKFFTFQNWIGSQIELQVSANEKIVFVKNILWKNVKMLGTSIFAFSHNLSESQSFLRLLKLWLTKVLSDEHMIISYDFSVFKRLIFAFKLTENNVENAGI